MPAPPNIAQTIHGYAQGHRLLALGGDVDERELAELDRLSDLSGYLPPDVGFDAYHTAFPCGRYHAYACTWLDADAPRRGTVLTHTLLIPRELWSTSPDALAWTALHRRPNRDDLAEYTRPLALTSPTRPPPPHDPVRMSALLGLLLGQVERPILWVSARPPFDLLRDLWPWLWPEARASWSFCTYALQPRRVGRRSFDFLGVPPAALGAFHELAGAAGWWREGMARPPDAPWVGELMARGPAAVHTLLTQSRDAGLPAPAHAGLLRTIQRYWELADGARERLAAARARLDLLERAWPELPLDHPEVLSAIDHVVELQPTAPLDPRPFWDLRHLLGHKLVEPHTREDSQLGERLLDCVREQVPDRLLRAQNLALDDFRGLYEAAGPRPRAAIRDGVALALTSSEADSTALGPTLLHVAEALADDELWDTTLRAMASSALVGWFTSRMRSLAVGPREELGRRLSELAHDRQDPELAAGPWVAIGEPGRALAAAAPIVESHPEHLASFEALLRGISDDLALTWCLAATSTTLTPLAIGLASEILVARDPTIEDLVAMCDGRTIGARVFARVCRMTNESDIEQALASAPALASELVATALRDSAHANPAMARAAIRVSPAQSLWSATTLAALQSAPPVGVGRWLDLLWSRLLSDIVRGELTDEVAGTWLTDSRASRYIERVDADEVAGLLRTSEQALARLVAAAVVVYLEARSRASSDLIARAVTVASAPSLSGAVEDLCLLVDTVPEACEHGRHLRAEMLGAVRTRLPDRGWILVEAVFYDVYIAVMSGKNFNASWWSMFDWDRGKHWRHWLVDVWIDHDWPPDSFVRCLGDLKLARKAFERADADGQRGRDWLMRLRPALERHPDLLRVWHDVARA